MLSRKVAKRSAGFQQMGTETGHAGSESGRSVGEWFRDAGVKNGHDSQATYQEVFQRGISRIGFDLR